MKFEYKTTHYRFRFNPDYVARNRKGSDWEPQPSEDPDLEKHLLEMGEAGWELVSVRDEMGDKTGYQSTETRGFLTESSSSTSFSYIKPIGFYFFWKRVKD